MLHVTPLGLQSLSSSLQLISLKPFDSSERGNEVGKGKGKGGGAALPSGGRKVTACKTEC